MKQPDTEARRVEQCGNIDWAVEQCVNRASDSAGYRACMHRLTPDQCGTLAASFKRFGEDKFPPERQAKIRQQCPDVFVHADFDCLTDSTMGLWTCTHTIIDEPPGN